MLYNYIVECESIDKQRTFYVNKRITALRMFYKYMLEYTYVTVIQRKRGYFEAVAESDNGTEYYNEIKKEYNYPPLI